MTPVNGDFDQMLRRALHAEADSIEPAEGGLERIRQRTHAPWLVRQTSLMLIECVDLTRLIGIRLEPRFTSARASVAARGGSRQAVLGLLSSMVAVVASVAPSRRHAAGRRGGSPHAHARAGSNLAWLRPALAVAGAVVIVVAGVYGLAQVRDNLVLELFPGSSVPASTSTGSSNSGHQVPTMTGQSSPPVIVPSGVGTGSAKPSPKATCKSASKAKATPTPTPTDSPTPTTTPTPTPTPDPTDSTGPAPSTSAGASTLSANVNASFQTVESVAPASHCASSSASAG